MSMNSAKVKEYLKEDVERIERLLEEVGCHMLWRTGDEVRGAPPNGRNHTAVSVNTETLFCRVYGEGETFRGDIFQLISMFRKEEFKQSFSFTKSLFGLGGKFVKDNKKDPLALFKNIRKQHKIITDINEVEVPKFGMESLADFVLLPHINLFYEGITTQTQEIFKVGYDPYLDRVIFPHFAYDDIDAVVGITGRTLRSKEEIEIFRVPKYWNYIKGYKKMYNLYGFSHSLPFIIKNGKIIIFEAEKSVMKQWSQTRNKGFSVSVGGHEISEVQVQLILKETPADTEVIIAFDRDVQDMKDDDGNPIGEQYLINQCKKFAKFRKVSYTWDTNDLLGEKDAPIDKGVKVFNELLNSRKFID